MRPTTRSVPVVATTVGLGLAAAIAWYWFKRDPAEQERKEESKKKTVDHKAPNKKIDAASATRAEVLQVLEAVASSQEIMRQVMRSLSEDLCKELQSGKSTLKFEEVYDKVASTIPPDPLETAGIQTNEFDRMLDKFSTDTEVRWAIDRIMGGSSTTTATAPASASEKQEISVEQVIDVHKFMLQQLKEVVGQVKSANLRAADLRSVTVAAQVIVSAKVLDKFGFTSEVVEHSVYVHQYALSISEEFTQCTMEIQYAMSELVVSNYPFMA